MSDHVSAVPSLDFADDEAVAAFDLYLTAYFAGHSPDDDLPISPAHLERALTGEGVTPLRTLALYCHLARDGVLTSQSRTIPPGHSWKGMIGGIPVWEFRSEPETTVWLETTWSCWRGWLKAYRQLRAAPLPGAVSESSQKEPMGVSVEQGPPANAGVESETEEGDNPEEIDLKKLEGRPADILLVMLREGWSSPNRFASQDTIADLVKPGLTREKLQRPFALLRRMGLIVATEQSRNGGTHLTTKGLSVTERLRARADE